MILTAGPDISFEDIVHVTDAVTHGWNEKWNEYIETFEKEFAQYIGVRYALTTSGGTGALWLGLASLDIEKGDEVILPDITYFACSDVIVHLGAKPVFVDVDRDTWVIDPESVKKAITKKTKAIMPVDLYGNPCDIKAIRQVAGDIPIIEDACPAVGSEYYDKKVGSLADAAAFSFQGAKIMTTGIGGMLVTDNRRLYERARYFNNHGESSKKFWQTSIGYSFEMSNLQAALGLSQLKRIDSFVAKKRQIFSWYKKHLKNLAANIEPSYGKTNYWMSSVMIKNRDKVQKELKKKGIDTRPFFYCISDFDMFDRADTPNAHHIAATGINLPSGLMLGEDLIAYISNSLLYIL